MLLFGVLLLLLDKLREELILGIIVFVWLLFLIFLGLLFVHE